MKKQLLPFIAMLLTSSLQAQEFIFFNDTPILADDIEKITYEVDPDFEPSLLAGRLASDEQTTLFSQALQLTGLADSLQSYWYKDYVVKNQNQNFRYRTDVHDGIAHWRDIRRKYYSVFVETDEVFAAKGITDLNQLKAYAKQVYDQMFPEDAAVSDPKDRRHSLNRFVAYHIIRGNYDFYNLTGFDGHDLAKNYNRQVADISNWHATLMPEGTLKCSVPTDNNMYVNHRGLKDGADKYGIQVHGAKVTGNVQAINGWYFYIDDVLTYDRQTVDQVLGSERWRIDFTDLSPDFISSGGRNVAVDYISGTEHSICFEWDALENFASHWNNDTIKENIGIILRPRQRQFWNYNGDELNILGESFDFSIQLPTLPAGEWQVRLGSTYLSLIRPLLNIYIDDKLVLKNFDLSLDPEHAKWNVDTKPLSSYDSRLCYLINAFVQVNKLPITQTGEDTYSMKDLVTGEEIIVEKFTLNDNSFSNVIIQGTDTKTGQKVDWSNRWQQYRMETLKEHLANQPDVMAGTNEYGCGSSTITWMSNLFNSGKTVCPRYVLATVVSDGKHPARLRLQFSPTPFKKGQPLELMLDFLEFCPKSVYANQDIPEE